MAKRATALAFTALLGTFVAGHADTTGKLPPAWPRPGSTTLIDNDRGAAYNVVYTTGIPSPMHQHLYDFAGLDLNTASIEVKDLQGTTGRGPVIKNDMWWLPKGK